MSVSQELAFLSRARSLPEGCANTPVRCVSRAVQWIVDIEGGESVSVRKERGVAGNPEDPLRNAASESYLRFEAATGTANVSKHLMQLLIWAEKQGERVVGFKVVLTPVKLWKQLPMDAMMNNNDEDLKFSADAVVAAQTAPTLPAASWQFSTCSGPYDEIAEHLANASKADDVAHALKQLRDAIYHELIQKLSYLSVSAHRRQEGERKISRNCEPSAATTILLRAP